MNLLLDTQILLWAAGQSGRLPARAAAAMNEADTLTFSVASLWEITIKRGLNRPDFVVEPVVMRRNLLAVGYAELPILAAHAFEIRNLPAIHGDPFDRILLAQAAVEGLTLLTSDRTLARYPGPILHV